MKGVARASLSVVAAVLGFLVLIAVPATLAAASVTQVIPAAGPVIVSTITLGVKPLAGVVVVVRRDGKEVGRGTSARDGTVEIQVSEAAQYEVTIDRASLPDGVGFVPGARTTLKPFVQANGRAPVVFQLTKSGAAEAETVSNFGRMANLVASGLRFGLVIALASVGLSLLYGTTGLTNFAHGELVTFGAVAAWFFNDPGTIGVPLVFAAVLGVLASGGLGASLEFSLFRPLRRRGMPDNTVMIVSIGLAFLLRYLISIIFEANPRQYAQFAAQSPTVHIGPLHLRPKDVIVAVVAALVLVGVGLFLRRARLGTAIRAVSDNRDLAESSGIDVQRVILAVWVMSAGLAGLGGILLGLTETVSWNMGQRVLLVMFAAVVLGGLGTTFGAMAGGIVVGVVSDVSTFWLDSDLKIVVALFALILVLLVRPNGIFGFNERAA